MKLLIDGALSPLVARGLQNAGYDTVHVRGRGLASASDAEILTLAEREDRIIISTTLTSGRC